MMRFLKPLMLGLLVALGAPSAAFAQQQVAVPEIDEAGFYAFVVLQLLYLIP